MRPPLIYRGLNALRRWIEDQQAKGRYRVEQLDALWVRKPGYLNLKVYRSAVRRVA